MKFTTLIVTVAAALIVTAQADVGTILDDTQETLKYVVDAFRSSLHVSKRAIDSAKPYPASVVGVLPSPLGIVSPAVSPFEISKEEKETLRRRTRDFDDLRDPLVKIGAKSVSKRQDEVNQNLDRRILGDEDRDIIDQALYELGVYGHHVKRNDFMKNEKEILKIRQYEPDERNFVKGNTGATDDKEASAMKRQDLSDDIKDFLDGTGLKKRDFVGALLDAADKATNGLLNRRDDDGIEPIHSGLFKSLDLKKRAVVANVDIDAKVDVLVKLYLDTLAHVSVGIKADITAAILPKIKVDAKVDITTKIQATVMAAVNLKVDALIQAHIAAHIKASLLSIVNVDIAANVDVMVTLEHLHIWLKAALHVVVDHLNVDLYVNVLGLLDDVLTVNIEDLVEKNVHLGLNIDADVVVNAAIAAVAKVDAKVLVQ